MSKAVWREALEPWAKKYADLSHELGQHCSELEDAELASFEEAANQPSMTNCWWATYDVAPLVIRVVKQERHKRRARVTGVES